MFCSNCGKPLYEDTKFCSGCGCPVQSNNFQGSYNKKTAMPSLILGIIGLVAWFIPIIGLPVGIIGLVMGVKALKLNRTTATIGIILSTICIVLTIINGAIGAYMGLRGEHPLVNKIMAVNIEQQYKEVLNFTFAYNDGNILID